MGATFWVGDTPRERYQKLSETDALPRDHGLLFVYDQEAATRTFVMRGMRYPIDIVFIDGTGTVTAVHSAVPEPGTAEVDLTRYAGRARWVLEIPQRRPTLHRAKHDGSNHWPRVWRQSTGGAGVGR